MEESALNKDHNNDYEPTVMSEYTRHHNVKIGVGVRLGLSFIARQQALNLTQRHKFLFTRRKGDEQHPTSATRGKERSLI